MGRGPASGCITMPTSTNTSTSIPTVTGTIIVGTTMGMFITNTIVTNRVHSRPGALPTRRSGAFVRILAFVFVAVTLLASAPPARSQATRETLRVENDYRECLYAKTKHGQYAKGAWDSDFGLIGECRNQWVGYMDVCAKLGFDNGTCVMKSRLIIHAVLNLTGK